MRQAITMGLAQDAFRYLAGGKVVIVPVKAEGDNMEMFRGWVGDYILMHELDIDWSDDVPWSGTGTQIKAEILDVMVGKNTLVFGLMLKKIEG